MHLPICKINLTGQFVHMVCNQTGRRLTDQNLRFENSLLNFDLMSFCYAMFIATGNSRPDIKGAQHEWMLLLAIEFRQGGA